MNNIKPIKSPEDLAINGAAPAFADPIHVGRPNIGDREAFSRLVEEIFDRRWLTNSGPLVERLEERIADLIGVKHCIAMCNGTVALEIAIRAAGLSGEVIVPSYTFIATAHALSWQGITPVFADIDPTTHTLDPDSVRSMITPRTTGIVATHLWGNACNTDALQAIANEHGLRLIYDAAHAFLCSHAGEKVGALGDAEVFSFHATKFFNTFEGGAITTNDDHLAQTMRLMRNFGFSGLDNVIHPGTNGKMTEICAAMGLVNLDSISEVVSLNRENYNTYRRELGGIDGLSILSPEQNEESNYQYIVLEVGRSFPVTRDRIVEALQAENILARKYFWPGCHRMEPYRALYPHAGILLPNTHAVAERVIVLPTGSTLPKGAISTIRDVCLALLQTVNTEN
jgi:dTDP-4-amino-4,6-dideoxygalactose transaminase